MSGASRRSLRTQPVLLVAGADFEPEFLRNDPQVGHFLTDDAGGITLARIARAGAAVLQPGLAAEHQDAAIELVVDDAVSTLGVAVDGRGVPRLTSRAGKAPRV